MNTLRGALVLIVLFVVTGCRAPVYQRGDVAIADGHEFHKFTIYLSEPLAPGRHELGALTLPKTDKTVAVAVQIDNRGEIGEIFTKWPSEVQPETLSTTTHDVFSPDGNGQLKATGTAKCIRMHAGGQCLFCSTHIWVEIVKIKSGGGL